MANIESQDPAFLKKMILLFENLGVNSDTEQSFVNGVVKDYQLSTESALALTKKKNDIIQLTKHSSERIKSREEQEIVDQLTLMKDNVFMHRNIIKRLELQIDALNPLIKSETKSKTVSLLRGSLEKVNTKLKERKDALQQDRKSVLMLTKQGKVLEALKKAKTAKKKEIEEERKNLKTSAISKLLLPGKWLEIYKENVSNKVKNLEEKLQKTTAKISKTAPAPKNKVAPENKTKVPQAKNVDSKEKTTPPPKQSQAKQKENLQIQRVSQNLFKDSQVKTREKVSAPSPTPGSKKLESIKKSKNEQFVRKKNY